MQSKTSENHEKIAEIDKEIADLAARNLVIVRLHTSGILNGSDYSAQSSEINNRISALRSERKKKLAEDEGDEQLDKLKELQGISDEQVGNSLPSDWRSYTDRNYSMKGR